MQVNYNNRPEAGRDLGNLSATGQHRLLHASKRMIVRGVSVVAIAAVAGTSTNKLALQLATLGADGTETDIGNAVDTEGGVAKGAVKALEVPNEYLDLKKGDTLILKVTKAGTGTWANAFASVDFEVKGF